MVRVEIERLIKQALEGLQKAHQLENFELGEIPLEHPQNPEHGDYATSVAFALAKQLGKNPSEAAELIASRFTPRASEILDEVKAVGGFVNFSISKKYLFQELNAVIQQKEQYGKIDSLKGKKIMVEYAHPNTHKEMHIGHMRTLITGEALARILGLCGAKVFRANYQGDIGPHVAKAIWGTQKILKERNLTWAKAEKLSLSDRAHLLGEGYVKGNREYEANKEEIDELNAKLYRRDTKIMSIYRQTREWSLDYFSAIYKQFGTKFDKLYFESQVASIGKNIVLKNIGRVFEKSEGAFIFDGEKYGLHKRVFITQDGNPTYEGKEMGLAFVQHKDFPFDLNVHVVANEQTGYFKVVMKALELIDKKFAGKEYHLPMGMVQLVGLKMSSRTGVVITVDGLLVQVQDALQKLITNRKLSQKEKKRIAEIGAMAAVKYSILKTDTKSNVVFDMKKSVSLDGDSGPYLLYTYARCRSILRKARNSKFEIRNKSQILNSKFSKEELDVLRTIYKFPEVVREAAEKFSPSIICSYIFDVAQKYNLFYHTSPVLQAETKEQKAFRLLLTGAVAQLIKNSLSLLGIQTLERM
ncbi:MAG: arginine--tRNA ligase [Candidatus Wildermuthbacteria bacterium]|nr:arginine--tRNA ligase [Candidatus Wildermuthbacteria bacterium]